MGEPIKITDEIFLDHLREKKITAYRLTGNCDSVQFNRVKNDNKVNMPCIRMLYATNQYASWLLNSPSDLMHGYMAPCNQCT